MFQKIREFGMRKTKPWVARRFQLHGFKGRVKRALLWTKPTYQEWFEYARLAKNAPEEFGDLSGFKDFEEWWKHPEYGFELFCEPPEAPPVQEVERGSYEGSPNTLLLVINLEQPSDKIVFNVKNLIQRRQTKIKEYVSQAKLTPSKEQKRIMIEKIKRYRLAYTLQTEGLVRREIAKRLSGKGLYGFRKNGEPQEPDLREVTRDIANAKKIIKRVEKGMFP